MSNDRDLTAKAQIEALVLAAHTAIKISDADAVKSAIGELRAICTDAGVSSPIRDVAKELANELGLDLGDAALESMKKKIAGLAGATAELKKAIDIAKAGESTLSVPKIANAAKDTLTAFNSLVAGLDVFKGDLRTASDAELKDVPDRLKQLLADLNSLRNALKAS